MNVFITILFIFVSLYVGLSVYLLFLALLGGAKRYGMCIVVSSNLDQFVVNPLTIWLGMSGGTPWYSSVEYKVEHGFKYFEVAQNGLKGVCNKWGWQIVSCFYKEIDVHAGGIDATDEYGTIAHDLKGRVKRGCAGRVLN